MPNLSQIDAKMVNKRSTVAAEIPTIPASNDHTDGSWNNTDVYSGEIFINETDEKVFIRIAGVIKEFAAVGTGGIKKDKIVVGVGGQTVFNTSSNISGDYEIFEDGVISIAEHSKTDTNEITFIPTIPEGTTITIIY